VEDGATQMDDVPKERITALKADRDRTQSALERARSAARPTIEIRPIVVERFGQIMRGKLPPARYIPQSLPRINR